MNQMDRFLKEVAATWGADSTAEAFFKRVLGILKPHSVGYLPLHFLVKDDATSGEVVDLMHWASRKQLFTEYYEYIPPDGEEHELSAEEVMTAVQTGVLVLPNGNRVTDFAGKVFPFFRGTDKLTALLTDGDA